MQLSQSDFQLIYDRDFLRQKREVTHKIEQCLSAVEMNLKQSPTLNKPIFPPGTLTRSGKISRGENYKGLPYLVLDFPRYSEQDRVFMYRTMFWWGNYFLCMLVSKHCGHQLKLTGEETDPELLINLGDSPWNYDINDPQWRPLHSTPDLNEMSFICMAKKISFEQIDNLSKMSQETFETLVSFLS